MPAQDGTGPLGQGPRSGRGRGLCNPGSNESAGQVPGRGRQGAGRGLGRGMGRFQRRRQMQAGAGIGPSVDTSEGLAASVARLEGLLADLKRRLDSLLTGSGK